MSQQRATAALMIAYGMWKEAVEILRADYARVIAGGYLNRTPEAVDRKGDFRASLYMRGGAIEEAFHALLQTLGIDPVDFYKQIRSQYWTSSQFAYYWRIATEIPTSVGADLVSAREKGLRRSFCSKSNGPA